MWIRIQPFHCNADPDSAFHSNTNPDPASKNNTDPDPHPGLHHKVLTYVEFRAVSGVFQNIDPPPPLQPASESSPRIKGRGVHTRGAVRGWVVNILEDARH
jgi:hypothetical protein